MYISEIRDIIDDFDDEFFANLLDDIANEVSNIERYLMNYHLFFNNPKQMNKILDSMNAVNLICQQTFLEPLRAYIQVLEDFFVEACTGRFGQSQWLSELMLLLVDEVRASFEDLHYRRTLDVVLLDNIRQSVKELLRYSGSDYVDTIKSIITEFSLRVHPDLVFTVFEANEVAEAGTSTEVHEDISHQFVDESVHVFQEFADALDSRSEYWQGRTAFILDTCILINSYLPSPVNEPQLTVAVYMHDVGMALLPDSFLFKKGRYDSIEIMQLQQHPIVIYGLMQQMPQWLEAAEMVYQHHERFNGKGYPNGTAGEHIHTGAKIIAIADAFYSLTHNRTDRGYKKSLSRAVAEINKNNGTQFDPEVVEAFNQALLNKVKQPH